MMGGPENGDLPLSVGPMGELTEVASAKRAVRGVLMERVEELEEVLGRTMAGGPFFSSEGAGRASLLPLDIAKRWQATNQSVGKRKAVAVKIRRES